MKNKETDKGLPIKKEKITLDEDVKNLMIERLKVLSSDTMFTIGSGGSYSRDDLIKHVEAEDEIGEFFTEMQMDWLKSFKNEEGVANVI